MQQRINNRWLSPLLLERVDARGPGSRPADTPDFTHNAGDRPFSPGVARATAYRSAKRRHRRMWQRVATGLLLIGSAAFSYLAWSQSGAGAQLPKQLPKAQTARDTRTSDDTDAPLAQSRVHALRVENRALQLRIAQLQGGIKNSEP